MFYHFQEEEEQVDMLEMDHKFQPTGLVSPRQDISTIINITRTRKILEKEILMKKFMELLLLILTSFHYQEEEIQHMLIMDQVSQETGLVFHRRDIDTIINITRKILEKEISTKKFMELPQLILMCSHFQEEEEILLMLEMDHKSQLDGLVLPKILPTNK